MVCVRDITVNSLHKVIKMMLLLLMMMMMMMMMMIIIIIIIMFRNWILEIL